MDFHALCAAECDGRNLTCPDPFRPSHLQQHKRQVIAEDKGFLQKSPGVLSHFSVLNVPAHKPSCSHHSEYNTGKHSLRRLGVSPNEPGFHQATRLACKPGAIMVLDTIARQGRAASLHCEADRGHSTPLQPA